MSTRVEARQNILKLGVRDQHSALFVGNDINNGIKGHSWSDLVKHLIKLVGAEDKFDLSTEPFPLIYEQLYMRGMRTKRLKNELELKNEIAQWACRINPSEIHRRILNLEVEHIITPNYDFALEKSAGLRQAQPERNVAHKESVYSLFRLYDWKRYKIWHIHGDVSNPRSINLGYEQYSGSLHRMRDYVLSGLARPEIGGALMARLNRGPIEIESWLDLFFTKNIYIFGFRFDQVEMHLWWLLAYRARRIVEHRKKKVPGKSSRFYPENEISYYYPESLLTDASRAVITRRRLKMLNSFNVKTIGCPGKAGTTDYYKAVLGAIRNKCTEKYGTSA